MFFKKKVGKGVRGEGKTSSPFLLFYFFFPFPLFLAVPCGLGFFGSKVPACARGWQREGRVLCGGLGDKGLRRAKNFWEPCGCGRTSPRWDGDAVLGCQGPVCITGMFGFGGCSDATWLWRMVRIPVPAVASRAGSGCPQGAAGGWWGAGMLGRHLHFYTYLLPEPHWFCGRMLPSPVGCVGSSFIPLAHLGLKMPEPSCPVASNKAR